MAIVNTKVGDFSLGEAFAIGLTKSLSEQLLSKFIGNGTFMSGAIKIVGAWAIPKYALKNQMGKTIGTALAVDGVEDALNALFKGGVSAQSTKPTLLI